MFRPTIEEKSQPVIFSNIAKQKPAKFCKTIESIDVHYKFENDNTLIMHAEIGMEEIAKRLLMNKASQSLDGDTPNIKTISVDEKTIKIYFLDKIRLEQDLTLLGLKQASVDSSISTSYKY
jgi:hypothetical protein